MLLFDSCLGERESSARDPRRDWQLHREQSGDQNIIVMSTKYRQTNLGFGGSLSQKNKIFRHVLSRCKIVSCKT